MREEEDVGAAPGPRDSQQHPPQTFRRPGAERRQAPNQQGLGHPQGKRTFLGSLPDRGAQEGRAPLASGDLPSRGGGAGPSEKGPRTVTSSRVYEGASGGGTLGDTEGREGRDSGGQVGDFAPCAEASPVCQSAPAQWSPLPASPARIPGALAGWLPRALPGGCETTLTAAGGVHAQAPVESGFELATHGDESVYVRGVAEPSLSLETVIALLENSSAWHLDTLPEVPRAFVGDVRGYQLPSELEPHLPIGETKLSASWSAFDSTFSSRSAWSDTGLRRALNITLAADAAQRDPSAKPPVVKACADDPEAMARVFTEVMEQSCVKHLWSRELSGPQVPSPFILRGWWEMHQLGCEKCAGFGDWDYVQQHNADNGCYISVILAILHHGLIIPF